MTTPVPPDLRTIRLIYLSLPLGVLLFLGVALFVDHRPSLDPASPAPLILLAVAAPLLIIALVLRSRIPLRTRAESSADWWRNHYTFAIIVWSLIEAAGLMGVVGFWLSGKPLPLVATAAAIVLFTLTSPQRLAGE